MYGSTTGDLLLVFSRRGVSDDLRVSLGLADDLRGASSSLYCAAGGAAYRILYAAVVGPKVFPCYSSRRNTEHTAYKKETKDITMVSLALIRTGHGIALEGSFVTGLHG